jgi:uncharacterized protein YecT (DUF1311 family)
MQTERFLVGLGLLLAAPLFFVPGNARADNSGKSDNAALTEQCESYHTSYDRTYCVAKLFMASDQELNDAYGKLKAGVQGATRQGLVQTQRDWMKYRDSTCESRPGEIGVGCNYRVNRERTNYLRDRLRECETGSCNNDRIAQKSW